MQLVVGVLAVVLAAAASVGIVYYPRTVTLVLAAVVLVALSVRYPKTAAGLIVLASLAGNEIGQHVSSAKVIDDAAIIVYAVVVLGTTLWSTRRLKAFPGWRWLLLFVVLGAIASLIRSPLVWAAEDAYLFLKGALFTWAVAQLDWSQADVKRIIRWGAAVGGVILVFCALNLLLPGRWYGWFTASPTASVRFASLRSLVGPFVHPGVLGQVAALLAAAFAAYALAFRRWKSPVVGAVLSAAAVVLTFRRKALIALCAAVATPIVARSRRWLLTLGIIVLIVVVVALAAWPLTSTLVKKTYNEYVANDSPAARVVLYRTSGEIAVDFFPLGAGFARYGSWMASTHYSPLYKTYGIDQVPGMGPGSTELTDTFWPAILGETGVFGLIAYALFLVAIFNVARHLARKPDPYVMFLGLLGCAWWVEFIIESVAAASYTSPPAYVLFFGLAGVMAAFGRKVIEPRPSRGLGAWLRRRRPARP